MFTQRLKPLNESRNLNSSSWTTESFKGDLFDVAFIVFADTANASSGDLHILCNGDSGSNYENNEMAGEGTSKPQIDTTSANSISITEFIKNSGSRNSLCIGVIRGDSSQDRVCMTFASDGQPRIANTLHKWTNNISELTDLTFESSVSSSYKWHIEVFLIPKLNNNSNYALVDTLNWSSSATEQSFTGLKGDIDLQYLIDWNSQDDYLAIELNDDASTNHTIHEIENTGSAFRSRTPTTSGTSWSIGLSSLCIINAETGDDRTAFAITGQEQNASPLVQQIRGMWYGNTATEITSIACTPGSSVTAEAKIFRAKYPQSSIPDIFDLPFKKVDSFSVNTEDFTTGQSFSGLDGDNVLLYRIEFKGLKDNFNINVRTNGDLGASDFAWQRLNGTGTAEAASSDTADASLRFIRGGDTAEQAYGVMYIYPQSGEYRPCLSYQMCDENEIELTSGWRLDTVTEITSILLFSSATTTLNGTFTLSEIRL